LNDIINKVTTISKAGISDISFAKEFRENKWEFRFKEEFELDRMKEFLGIRDLFQDKVLS